MELITVVVILSIITDCGSVAEAEALSVLLTDVYTVCELCSAIACVKLFRTGVCLDGCSEFLSGTNVEVLDIICIELCGFGTGRCFVNGCKAVPCNTITIYSAIHRIKYALLDTGFIKLFTGLVPCKYCHYVFPPCLIIDFEHIM